MNYISSLIAEEKRVLDEIQESCPTQVLTLDGLTSFTFKRLGIEAKNKFWNAKVLEYLLCSMRSTLVMPKYVSNERFANTENVSNYIRDIIYIAQGQDGIVSSAAINGLNDLILIKNAKAANNTLFHELFVGIVCLNKLRRILPNFMYTYAYFSCELPRADEKNSKEFL